MNKVLTILLPAAMLLLNSCGPNDQAASDQPHPLENYLLAAEPADAIPVAQAVEKLSPGEKTVVKGQVGGKVQAINEDFALMVIADSALTFCDEMEDDHCETPWDACCEDPDKIKTSRATLQILDETGAPIAATLRGLGGLKELDHISVTGTVDPSSTKENLLINASGIYIHEE